MKKQILFIVAILMSLGLLAQAPKGKAKPGTVYGAKTEANGAHDAAEIPSMLAKKDTVATKIRATVLDVCSAKGCWLTFKINDTESAFVKMKDYGFFVPMDLKGKTVILDGITFTKVTSVEDQKHYAEDAKKPQSEIDAIKEAKKEIRFLANGILVE